MSEEYVIATDGLTRHFGRLAAVNDLALRVPQGSIYGFLGPNGAGKTTTIRLLLGLLRSDAGQVRLFGGELPRTRQAALARIGSLVETPSLYGHLTGWENLEILRRLRGGTETQVRRALVLTGLDDAAAGRLVKQYSLGMRQRLGLACALLAAPDLLILDEPTNGLDPAGIHEMRDLIRRLPDEYGVTVFVSSHLLGEVEQMATHIGIIQAGRLAFQGTAGELRARYQDHVTVGVDRPSAAQRALALAGWRATLNGDGRLRVAANGQADAAVLATALVRAGFSLFHIGLEQPSLEDIFLQLTGAVATAFQPGVEPRSLPALAALREEVSHA